ncbi:hypothetical protein [Pseudomonas chlororaphis]|uniref:hypothetical protein n=1 Tax=Pseudomonas chlororaphis TaxID=587753 RepID=UPI000F570A0E|nr:hypothetical protein [Pseudomonas chlororaphis]
MDRLEIATTFAKQLHDKTLTIEKSIYNADPCYGIKTKQMLHVTVSLSIPPPHKENLFKTIHSLFPENEGENVRFRSLRPTGDIEIIVCFPIPYKSAERFPVNQRGSFNNDMALYSISKKLLQSLPGMDCEKLLRAIPDPRHPNEIAFEKRKAAVNDFLKRPLRLWKTRTKRDFSEYLK